MLRFLAFFAVFSLVFVSPYSVAVADDGQRGGRDDRRQQRQLFSLSAQLVQTSPGSVTPIMVPGFPFPVGVAIVGEVFSGSVNACVAQRERLCPSREGGSGVRTRRHLGTSACRRSPAATARPS